MTTKTDAGRFHTPTPHPPDRQPRTRTSDHPSQNSGLPAAARAIPRNSTGRSVTPLHHGDFYRGFLARRSKSGEMVRIGSGTYMAPPPEGTPWWEKEESLAYARAVSVARDLDPRFVVSGSHAALLLGASISEFPAKVLVLGPGKPSTTHGSPYYKRRERNLSADDVVTVNGIRVTSVPRTIIEVARTAGPRVGLQVADSLLNKASRFGRGRVASSGKEAQRILEDAHRILAGEPRIRGNPAAKAVLHYADPGAETPIETEVRRHCLILGLPRPVLQEMVLTDMGPYYPDLTLRIQRKDGSVVVLHVEADGQAKYENNTERERQHARDAALRRLGHEVVRLSGWQILNDCEHALQNLLMPLVPWEVRTGLRPVDELRERPSWRTDRRRW